jgi:hypothetical protein
MARRSEMQPDRGAGWRKFEALLVRKIPPSFVSEPPKVETPRERAKRLGWRVDELRTMKAE